MGDGSGIDAGEAYVVFGKDSGFGYMDSAGRQVIDLTTLGNVSVDEPVAGFVIRGDLVGDGAGFSVSGAGDVNGDGFADLIIGAPGGDGDLGAPYIDGAEYTGKAYVVFGHRSTTIDEFNGLFYNDPFGNIGDWTQNVLDLSRLGTFSPHRAADGFVIQGAFPRDIAGLSVSEAGDVNGDGYSDVIIGAPKNNSGGTDSGEAYVVFGHKSSIFSASEVINIPFGAVGENGQQTIDLASIRQDEGFIIRGASDLDYTGFSVSGAGDVNGDGIADLVVGAPRVDDGTSGGPRGGSTSQSNVGEAYVIFATTSGFGYGAQPDAAGRRVIDLTTLTAAQGFIIQGDKELDEAGFSVSEAGDVNGDGYADIIVGAKRADEAYVVFGKASGFGETDATGRQVVDLANLAPVDGFVMQGAGGYGNVSGAGDINGDGYADLIVGTHGDVSYVVFGKASGFGGVADAGRPASDGFDHSTNNSGGCPS